MKRPSARLLVTFSITLVMLSLHFAGAFLGFMPDTDTLRREGRAALAEVITLRSVRLIADSELNTLEDTLELLVKRNPEMLSAAVRRADGNELIRVGEHDGKWNAVESSYSTDSQLTVPIMEGGREWGQLELRFEPLRRTGWQGFLDRPLTKYSIFLAVIGFLALYFVLGKMLRHLDPSKAVPARVRSALDTIMEGLLAVDLKGQIVLANQAFSVVAGKTPEALLGVKIGDLPWSPDADSTETDIEYPWEVTLREGTPCTSSAAIHLIDGESKRRTFLVNCSPVMGGEGQHVGVLIGLGDVTELEEKEIQLRLSKERAESANRAKSEFLANMSHEIRTPMNAILGFTEMLKRGYARSESDNREYLNTIHSSGKFLLELINDLLDLSKIEAGSLELEQVYCPVQDIAREVLKTLSVKTVEKGIALELNVDTPIPATIETDPLRVRQIITNLVGNAIKFTESGSVTVGIRYEPETAPRVIAIDVTDTGIGMTSEQIDKIFSPFVQADVSISRRFGGTGLGLSISRRFAEALGGGIEVTSTPDVGSVFTVLIDTGSLSGIPILTPNEALQESLLEEEEVHASWAFAQEKILVADDGKQNRDLLRLVLAEHGLQVTEAADGQEAVAAARTTNFDMILMDLEMPIMNGVAATTALRANGVDVPILALTAHSLEVVEKEINEAGFSGYISKPIDIDVLLEHIAQMLNVAPSAPRDSTRPIATERIVSRLPVNDPRYKAIVTEFVDGLGARMDAMSSACEEHDFERLGKLAHSLKGLAGTVGFDQFTKPIKALESAALAENSIDVDDMFSTIKTLAVRVVTGHDAAATNEHASQVTVDIDEILAGPPITSRLSVADPLYLEILMEFIGELQGRFDAMEHALNQADYSTLGSLAHGFIGVAGIVGFAEFTEPTRQLEAAAQSGDGARAGSWIAALRALGSRVVSPEPHTDLPRIAADQLKSQTTAQLEQESTP